MRHIFAGLPSAAVLGLALSGAISGSGHAQDMAARQTFQAYNWGEELTIRGQGGEAVQPRELERELFANPTLTSATEGFGLGGIQPAVAAETVTAQEATVLGQAGDAGQILQESVSIQTAAVKQRSQLAQDPYIRGYQVGQIYSFAEGAWYPVRQDLDAMLSKIDPALIDSISVIPGPYAVTYGPGLAYFNIDFIETPRYLNGYEAHNRLGMTYRANGGQIFGRETFYGGGADYGYILNYSLRTGSDYEAGNGQRIPASYEAHSFWGQGGFDLSANSSIEIRYQHLDQNDTEFPAQFFDVEDLDTDSYVLSYQWDDGYGSTLVLQTWYNRTDFDGNTLNKRRPDFPVLQRVDQALIDSPNTIANRIEGFTNGDVSSLGARAARTLGETGFTQLTIGADFRFLEHQLEEFYIPSLNGNLVSDLEPFGTNQPRSKMTDPGLFAETAMPLTPYWQAKAGARVDFVNTTADEAEVRSNTSLVGVNPNTGQFEALDQSDVLYLFYLTNDVELTESWTARFGFGHGQRVPTLTERYADGIFLGIIQSGFSRVIGRPDLDKERSWQLDSGLEYEGEFARGRANAFYSWIHDYITYEANVIADPTGARLLRAINTDYATLKGTELYGEVDLTSMVTAFSALRYVEGIDEEIDQPLAGIYPLEGRAGLRFHEPYENSRWGIEFGARMVDDQDDNAFLRTIGAPGNVVRLEDETPGFTVAYTRGYYNLTPNFNVIYGIENLFDRTYLEHLNLRLPADNNFAETAILSPGFTPYFGAEWNY